MHVKFIGSKSGYGMRFLLFGWLCLLPFASAAQWVSANNGLYGGQVTSLQTLDGNIYAGTPGGVYLSTDDGISWTGINTGLDVTSINGLAVSGGKVLAATNGGGNMFVTTNQGASWEVSNTGLPVGGSITDLAVTPGHVFGLTTTRIFYQSIDDGATWTLVNTGLADLRSMTASGSNMFLGTESNGVFRSADNGVTWTPVNSGLGSMYAFALESYANFVVAWTPVGVFISANNGDTWTNTGLPHGNPSLMGNGNTLIYGNDATVYRSTDNGVSWSLIPELQGATSIIWHENAFIEGHYYGIYKSTNDGVSWSVQNEGLTNASISGFAELNNKLYVSALGVFRSANNGHNWVPANNGLPEATTSALTVSDNALIVACFNYGIYRSVDEGNSWSLVFSTSPILSFAKKGTLLFAGGSNGIFMSADNGASWTLRSSAITHVSAITVQGDKLFAGGTTGATVSVSNDDGITWATATTGLPASFFVDETLFAFKGKVFAGPANISIYATSNEGASWQPATIGLAGTTRQVYSFAARGDVLFTGTNSGVYFSENTGVSWTPMNDQLPIIDISNEVGKLFGGQKYLFSGHRHKGVWRWMPPCIPLPVPSITVQITETDTTLISSASSGNQWYLNGDAIEGATGQTWVPVSPGNYTIVVTEDDCTSNPSDPQFVTIVVVDPPDPLVPLIKMPNVFTPNGDGLNPAFVPIEFQDIPQAALQVFDRWGKQVYTTRNLNAGWDGGEYPSAMYFYLITYTSQNGTANRVKGWVHLVR